MSELRDLYQEVILDHYKHPRNYRDLPDYCNSADGHNRLCGDKLRVYARVENNVIQEVTFKGSGCAIATASASLMTEALKGKTIAEAKVIFEQFHHVVTGSPEDTTDVPDLGKLTVLAGVREFPVRVKCATLAWHTLAAALKNEQRAVSTE